MKLDARMEGRQPGQPIAILAGGGALPMIATAAAVRAGRRPTVFAIAGNADPAGFADVQVHELRFGEVGKLWRVMAENACAEAVFVGSISRRPAIHALRPDLQALSLVPRVAKLMRGGDDGLLSGIAQIFEEKGIRLVSVVDIAPDIVLPEGVVTMKSPGDADREDIAKAGEAARVLGSLDIGQAAVCIEGRVVAVEGAEGTDGMMERIQSMRESGRIPAMGGVMVKRVKPHQDRRFDLPTIGPDTARRAGEAKLAGVAAEADGTLLVGRGETIAAFDQAGLFLLGVREPEQK